MEEYSKMIFTSDHNYTDQEKKFIEDLCKRRSEELTSIYVIYRPDCGCPIEQIVLLDRYPMSEKIHMKCPECNKGCLTEISDPIIFHCPLLKQDYSQKDLKEFIITESRQKEYIESYRNE